MGKRKIHKRCGWREIKDVSGVSDPFRSGTCASAGAVWLQLWVHPTALQSSDVSREIHEALLSVCMSVLSVFFREGLLGNALGESEVIIGGRALLPSAPG